jgi:hypothetical protein
MVQAILERRKTQTRRISKIKYDKMYLVESDKRCTYGIIGDRLWVRETFAYFPDSHNIRYKADGLIDYFGTPNPPLQYKWKPSLFMKQVDSRITLEITNTRLEKLHDISESDAKAEGVMLSEDIESTYRIEYAKLWDKINGAGSWDSNPYVWVIEFKKI